MEVRQSLLLSEGSEGLLEVPLKTAGRLYLPYSQTRGRYLLQQSAESVCVFFRGAVRKEEVKAVLGELATKKWYSRPPKWLNVVLTTAVLGAFLLVKVLLILLWFFILLDPLVLIGGFWLLKRLAVLLCVIRLDLLSSHYHKPLRRYLHNINSQWTRYGLEWTMEAKGAWISLGPLGSN